MSELTIDCVIFCRLRWLAVVDFMAAYLALSYMAAYATHTTRAGSLLASNDSVIQLQLEKIVSELKDQKAVLNYIQEQVDQKTVKLTWQIGMYCLTSSCIHMVPCLTV